jgi:hypothetical protein
LVFDIIKRSKEYGVNIESLADRSGYTKKSVVGYLSSFSKDGKIISLGRYNDNRWVAKEYSKEEMR